MEDVDPEGDAMVRCDSCFAMLRRKATRPVMRQHGSAAFEETWCIKCIEAADENTTYSLGTPEAPASLQELGLDS